MFFSRPCKHGCGFHTGNGGGVVQEIGFFVWKGESAVTVCFIRMWCSIFQAWRGGGVGGILVITPYSCNWALASRKGMREGGGISLCLHFYVS